MHIPYRAITTPKWDVGGLGDLLGNNRLGMFGSSSLFPVFFQIPFCIPSCVPLPSRFAWVNTRGRNSLAFPRVDSFVRVLVLSKRRCTRGEDHLGIP